MVSYADNLTRADQQFTVIVTLEGVGHWLSDADLTASASEGLTQFSYEVPGYVDTALPIHRPYVAEAIDVLSERVDTGGGFPDLGAVDFAIVDVDDYLTTSLRTRRQPATLLDGDITASATSLVVGSTTGMSASDTDGGVLYMGAEAMKVVSVDSGTAVTVQRGYLGTTAVAHTDTETIRFSIPYLGGRTVTVKLVPQDADDVSEETVLARYSLDQVSWDAALNVWRFSAKSRLKYLHRRAPLANRHGVIVETGPRPFMRVESTGDGNNVVEQLWTGGEANDPLRQAWVMVGTEVMNGWISGNRFFPTDRGLFGTSPKDLTPGTVVRQVYVADTSLDVGSFRYATDLTTSRTSGAWVQTDHWVDIILCLLTSSADESDGLELTNRNASYPNYSSLPPGYGIGLPHALVDWDSWMDVKARTLDYRFPYFVYGDKPESFGALIQRHFLRPMGAYLSIENGTAKVILPRLPLANSATVSLGPAQILTRPVGRGLLREPRQELKLDLVPPGSVTYRVGPEALSVTYRNEDFARTYGGRSFFETDDRGTVIDVPGGDPALSNLYGKRAASRIFRQHVPNAEVQVDLTMDTSNLAVGDLARYTLGEMPDMSAGARGWTDVVVEKLEGEVRIPLDDVAHVATRLRAYGPGVEAARITPSAYIEAVDGGNPDLVTVSANRFTESDATGGLPTTDAAAFTVDDVVVLVDLDGTDLGGGTQIVLSVSGNDIELDGNFGGALTNSAVLEYATFDDVDVANGQDTDFAYMADRATSTRGTSGVPNVYGEA